MPHRRARPRARAALSSVLLATALAVTACTAQPEVANDNGPQPDPTQPGDVVQTPEAVEEAPPAVEEVPAEKQAEVPEAPVDPEDDPDGG